MGDYTHVRQEHWRQALEVLMLSTEGEPLLRYLARDIERLPLNFQVMELVKLVEAMADLATLVMIRRWAETGLPIGPQLVQLGRMIHGHGP